MLNSQYFIIKMSLKCYVTAYQCFQRFQIISQANSSKSGWSTEDNAALFRLVAEYGAKWTTIGKLLGRTAYVCRAAYKRFVDKAPAKTLKMPKANDEVKAMTMVDLVGSVESDGTINIPFVKWNASGNNVTSSKQTWSKEEVCYACAILLFDHFLF